MTAVSIVGSVTGATSGTAVTSIAVNKPTGVASGDRLLACIYQTDGTPGIPSLSGWTQWATTTDGIRRHTWLQRIADGTEGASFTFTWTTAARVCANLIALRNTSTIWDAQATAIGSSTTPAQAYDSDGEFVVFYLGQVTTGTANRFGTYTRSMTEQLENGNGNNGTLGVATVQETVDTSQTYQATSGTNGAWWARTFSFRPAEQAGSASLAGAARVDVSGTKNYSTQNAFVQKMVDLGAVAVFQFDNGATVGEANVVQDVLTKTGTLTLGSGGFAGNNESKQYTTFPGTTGNYYAKTSPSSLWDISGKKPYTFVYAGRFPDPGSNVWQQVFGRETLWGTEIDANAGNMYSYQKTLDGGTPAIGSANLTLDGNWHIYATTHDPYSGASNHKAYWDNGSTVVTGTASGSVKEDNTVGLFFGRKSVNNSDYYAHDAQVFVAFQRTLSAAEIDTVMHWIRAARGTASLSGNASIAADGTVTTSGTVHAGSASLSGNGSLSVTGVLVLTSTVAAQGNGSLSGSAQYTGGGVATLTGNSSLSPTGARVLTSTVDMQGNGSTTVRGDITYAAGSVLSGDGSLSATAALVLVGTVSLVGNGSIFASTDNIQLGQADLNGNASISAPGILLSLGSGALSGNSALSATGLRTALGNGFLTGTSTIVAAANLVSNGLATLSGNGSVTASGILILVGVSTLSGNGSVVAPGAKVNLGSATPLGNGSLAVSGVILKVASSALAGNGSLVATGARTAEGQALLEGNGILIAESQGWTIETFNSIRSSGLITVHADTPDNLVTVVESHRPSRISVEVRK